jgi:hypothetical protein
MSLTAQQIHDNRCLIFKYINEYISSPRKEKLIALYEKFDERLTMMPASYKKEYHNSFEGGYYDHIVRVIEAALKLHDVWVEMGVDSSTYTKEELIFSALNHDLGKIGDENYESYVPQTDQWRRDKLGEEYMFNNKLPFASVPDRGLFLLQLYGVTYTFNEMIAIQTHDGLYDESNKKYLFAFLPEQKPRTSLPYIIHQADLMASRIEFEREWLPKFKSNSTNNKNNFSLETNNSPKNHNSNKNKALNTIKSEGLKNILNNL